ncbi:MAG: DUF4197 domain-containing protein [Lewinellaceae bacterium]|nr:DUF4197 domain-containing protein [Saprospiraceae bacterium]MCB9314677.1 DUF4197 domain-containing protein [Lewinellaceae bacterium]MCB9334198.1 DUF4197 domain-containing protein [Lewinellaceae bacterium]
MKKFTLAIFLFSTSVFFSSCDTLQQIANEALSEPSLAEIGQGLKEALNNGVANGVNTLSARDGYFKSAYKILLPAEARQVTDKLKVVPGFTNLENELLEKINHGAEDAAKEAGPIFVTAIRSMSFQDATNILMGADDAATQYLHKTTYDQLYEKFNPKIVVALNNIGANDLWKKAADAYNKIPLVSKVNNDLGDYVTTEALKGLFSKIEEEEKNIRRNPVARTTSLLKKVFSKQDTNRK